MTAHDEAQNQGWAVIKRDADAGEWQDIARYALWLRSPAALDATPPAAPTGMEETAERLRRLGVELTVLEHDLTECLNEFKQAYQVLYRDSSAIALKKFSIVYHIDNFLVRVHKVREDVYRLLAIAAGLDHSGDPKHAERSRGHHVMTAFQRRRLDSISKVVQQFDRDPKIAAALDARHLFVHQFRDDPGRPELSAETRVRDFEDQLAAQVSAITDIPAIDRYADRKAGELFDILNAIRLFRSTLSEAFESEVVKVIAGRSPETRRRLQPFVDFWNLKNRLDAQTE